MKEYGEGIDRIHRELAVNGLPGPKFVLNGFILSATITKYLETSNRVSVNEQGVSVNEPGVSVNGSKVLVNGSKVLVNDSRVSVKYEKVLVKATTIGDSLPEISKSIIRIMIENPYVTRPDLAKAVNVSVKTIGVHIAAMRGKYINRIGSDKNGFWEVIDD